MTQHFPLLYTEATSRGPALEVSAPYDGAPIAMVYTADSAAVEAALAIAHRLYQDRDSWLQPVERLAILEKTIQLMEARAEELAVEAAREGGKPLLYSRVEVGRAIDGVRLCIEGLRTQAGVEIPMGLTGASLQRLALYARRADRRRGCRERLQPPPEPDRSPGRAGRRHGLPPSSSSPPMTRHYRAFVSFRSCARPGSRKPGARRARRAISRRPRSW